MIGAVSGNINTAEIAIATDGGAVAAGIEITEIIATEGEVGAESKGEAGSGTDRAPPLTIIVASAIGAVMGKMISQGHYKGSGTDNRGNGIGGIREAGVRIVSTGHVVGVGTGRQVIEVVKIGNDKDTHCIYLGNTQLWFCNKLWHILYPVKTCF